MPAHVSPQGPSLRENGVPWARIVIRVVVVLLAICLIVGVMLLLSVRGMMGKVDAIKTQAGLVEQSALEGNADQLRASSAELSSTIEQINGEMQSPAWVVGQFIPFVGRDISNVRTFVSCANDLSKNALPTLVEGVAGMRLHDLVIERAVNVGMLAELRNPVVAVSPVLVKNAQTVAELQPGVIGPINDVLDEARAPLVAGGELLSDADRLFTVVLGMLGEGGQTRTYALFAQTNAEIRAGGGFPGSVGTIQVTDGYATLSEFYSVYDVKNLIAGNGYSAPITNEELKIFGDVLGSDAAAITITPNFMRSGEIAKQQWENAYGITIDGVVAMDPVFLQRILGLIGGITAFDGTQLNGQNTASDLMSGVYRRYGFDADGGNEEDMFFVDVAHKTSAKLLDAMGGFDLNMFAQLWNTVKKSGVDRRFQVWMADGVQESFMQDKGLSGNFQTDASHPQLGVYANDNTWSKICWYLDVSVDLGAPTRNADGTSTYNVTAHFKNKMSENEAATAPDYVTGTNPLKRSLGDMVEGIVIMAPIGGSIENFSIHQDAPLSAESSAPIDRATVYGRDTYGSRINILPGGDTTLTFTLMVPAGTQGDPVVMTSPPCHE